MTRLYQRNLDYEYMRHVVDVYLSTKDSKTDECSIKETAERLRIARTKVRKILVTMGEMRSPLADRVSDMIKDDMPLKVIAAELGLSISTVSTYIPYQTMIYKGGIKSCGAIRTKRYRDRIQYAKENSMKANDRQKLKANMVKDSAISERSVTPGMTAWRQYLQEHPIEKQPQFSGMINERDYDELLDIACSTVVSSKDDDTTDKIKSKLIQSQQTDLARLRLELVYDDYPSMAYLTDGVSNTQPAAESPDDLKILRTVGDVKYGDTITRDIIVPTDITLHALHYVIQRAFGWQNSHLHTFSLPGERFAKLVGGGMKDWVKLVGIVFRSPMMDEDAAFWDDDYEDGSFRNWLREKYTAPYVCLNRGEGYTACKDDMDQLVAREKDRKYIVEWRKADNADGEVFCNCYPKLDHDGKPARRVGFVKEAEVCRKEELSFIDLPYQAIHRLFEADTHALLERLTIGETLAFGDRQLIDDAHPMGDTEHITENCDELIEDVQDFETLDDFYKDDVPTHQPMIGSITDTLYYNYDFGDNWYVKITGSWNCVDLVDAGRVTQKELDEAIISVRLNDHPACIARDGLNVMDDVGNMDGYIRFLRDISEGKDADAKRELLEWAKSMGWSKRRISPKNVL